MAWSVGISVLGEGTDATRVVLGTLLGEEPKVTTPRSFEFTVGHGDKVALKEVSVEAGWRALGGGKIILKSFVQFYSVS